MINVKALVKEQLGILWSRYGDEEFCELLPLSIDEVPTRGIIFIGINPSISDEKREKLLSTYSKEILSYPLKDEGMHPYFKKFVEIAQKTDLAWGHLDLLYVQETNQKKVESLTKSKKGLDFIYSQLMVTKTILDQLLSETEPIVFVVNNTLARTYLGKDKKDGNNEWMNYNFEWNKDLGTYQLDKHPFLFTSMLTGQRALDNGSFERLIWQISFIKKQILEPTTTLYEPNNKIIL